MKDAKEERIVKNTCMIVREWKLSNDELKNFQNLFPMDVLNRRPKHSSGCYLCHKFALKGCCFNDCHNKDSHKMWSDQEKKAFGTFLKEVRSS